MGFNVTLDETIFGVESLTEMVRSFGSEPSNRKCTQLFMQGRQIMPEGPTASWEEYQSPRHLAPIAGRDSPHIQVAPSTVIPRASAMAHIKVYKDLPAGMLLDRRAPGQMGADERVQLNNALTDLEILIGNAKERMCALLLSTGKITVNTTNFPGSQIAFTVDFSSGNGSYTVTASWATPTTKILSDELVDLERAFRDASAKELGRLIGNAGIKQYLLQNTEVQSFAVQQLGAQVLQGGPNNLGKVLPGLSIGGYDWEQADGVYKPEGGSVTRYWGDNVVAALPAGDLRDTLAMAEGHGYVPQTSIAQGVGAGAIRKAPSRGMYAYAAVNVDVPSVRLYAGWVGLPILLTPQDLTLCADVTTP